MYTQSVRELNFNSLISVPDLEMFNCLGLVFYSEIYVWRIVDLASH